MKASSTRLKNEKRLGLDPRVPSSLKPLFKSPKLAKTASVTVFRLPPILRSKHAPSNSLSRNPTPSISVPKPPERLSLEHFRLMRIIGTGTFSRVRIASLKSTQEVMVVKIMLKADIVKKRQVGHVRNEREILGVLKHPFIVNLKCSFQDRDKLYLVQEYVPGGELYRILRLRGSFTAKETRFYAAEVISAMVYIHSQHITYRDLKPENLLLSELGHVKVADFGFAKRLGSEEKTFTLCGTPEYLAPEVIQQRGHDYSCDWWGVGILIYEMIVGHAPFMDNNPFLLYEKIVKAPLVFPKDFDSVCKEVVSGLLQKTAESRMKAEELMRHEFFSGVDWTQVEAERLVPPYVPTVRTADDTSNFDQYPEEKETKEQIPVTYDLFQNF